MNDWQERLRRSFSSPHAARDRRLFDELNPGLDHTPILREPPKRPRPAAVMIGVRDIAEPTVVLTLRAPTMPSHAGQISLPGGTPKEDDDGLIGTALRETHEEVGVPAEAVSVLGNYGLHYGGLGYVVTPVIGIIDGNVPIEACPREVSEVFEVPLSAIADPGNHVIQEREFSGVPYNMFAVPVLDTAGQHRNIWGLTAGILRTLSDAIHDDA
ncbi:NUDIX hydrolase [Parvularcula lutaonensis]|uniref:NUDIX hydrolase n=1 Tax=Parvularcula lutaonensis TaxID=491923 RepID=A0ABV7M7J2_9PROT|nr:CoA pyrophosphatase [Parvularcula lutaonensis]GGY42150.1 coenzyme A pyrophosphatase [Parvularcula lutaonensis]